MSRESGLAQAVRLMNEPRTDIKISHNSTCRKHMTKCTRAEMPTDKKTERVFSPLVRGENKRKKR